MGMAANQARLMSLTARQSDLELRAQQISATKMRLAQASSSAALEYSNAINQTGMQQVTTMENRTVQTPIYGQMAGTELKNWLTNSNYVLYNGNKESAAVSGLSASEIDALINSGYSAATKTVNVVGATYNLSDDQIADGICKLYGANWKNDGWLATPAYGQSGNQYYLNFNQLGINAYHANNTAEHWGITHSLEQIAGALGVQPTGGTEVATYNYVTIPTVITGYNEETIQVPVTTVVQGDSQAIQLAQDKYNAFIVDISAQEKIFDMELTQINTEHEAIKTEYDAIKTLIGDNTERSFNVFG